MLTTFEITTDTTGILVSQKRGGKIIKKTYALDQEEAEIIRTWWVDEFWGFPRTNFN